VQRYERPDLPGHPPGDGSRNQRADPVPDDRYDRVPEREGDCIEVSAEGREGEVFAVVGKA